MFFKMLKSDLKRKKGLNAVLFIFIVIASAVVFAGAVQVYSNLTRTYQALTYCNSSDIAVMGRYKTSEREQYVTRMNELISQADNVKSTVQETMLFISADSMHFPGYKGNDPEKAYFPTSNLFLAAQPLKQDLLYDLEDKPFYVESGQIALPQKYKTRLGLEEGDTVTLTTDLGNVYEFEVCTFFRDPIPYAIRRFIVCEEDFQVIKQDYSVEIDYWGVQLENNSYMKKNEFTSIICEVPIFMLMDVSYTGITSDDDILTYIISVFCVVISIFMILIIFMTIRFIMIAELKEEEREIGMMRALGVESLSFRWLLGAKYIFFAFLGGAIGIAAGYPLSQTLVTMFSENSLLPPKGFMLVIGISAVLLIIGAIILFTLSVIKRIEKISVIDAIRGENRRERIGKSSVIGLEKRKKMPVPLFLAVSDILSRFKRYVFLIITYILGAAVMLLVFNVKNSVIDPEFMKYYLVYQLDFGIDFNEETDEKYMDMAISENISYFEALNRDLKNAGIPAYIDEVMYSYASLVIDDGDGNEDTSESKAFSLIYGDENVDKYPYRKGSRAPAAKNEIALSYFTANELGIDVGDTLNVCIDEYDEHKTGIITKEVQFTVTGLFDKMEMGGDRCMLLSPEYENVYNYYANAHAYVIDSEDKEKVFAQLEEYFGSEQILTADEFVEDMLEDYVYIFDLLIYVMGGGVLFILVLITYLYMNVFITEEISEIALMKSVGFDENSIRLSQLMRMGILTVSAVIIALILHNTAGIALVRLLFRYLELTGFGFLPEIPVNFIVIPLAVICPVIITAAVKLIGIKDIDMRRISEE